MDIVCLFVREGDVDDVWDPLDVDPPGGDVCADQKLHLDK